MNNKLDYQKLFEQFSWLKEANKTIISPDVDGFLCGLLVSYYLRWEIVGFYDGGRVLINKDIKDWRECVFLDMEIYQKNIRSIGNHLLLYNKNQKPQTWSDNFALCINPNNLRDFDKIHDFRKKYPFGTIHFLVCALENMGIKVYIPRNAVGIILFADGVFKNIMNYPENCIDWLEWLNAKELRIFRYFSSVKFSDVVHNLERVFMDLHLPRGKLAIKLINNNVPEFQERILKFLRQLSNWTGWVLEQNKWKNLELNNLYQPIEIKRGREQKINGRKYEKWLKKENIFSFSFPSYNRFEYSIIKT